MCHSASSSDIRCLKILSEMITSYQTSEISLPMFFLPHTQMLFFCRTTCISNGIVWSIRLLAAFNVIECLETGSKVWWYNLQVSRPVPVPPTLRHRRARPEWLPPPRQRVACLLSTQTKTTTTTAPWRRTATTNMHRLLLPAQAAVKSRPPKRNTETQTSSLSFGRACFLYSNWCHAVNVRKWIASSHPRPGEHCYWCISSAEPNSRHNGIASHM